ncbi:hypothetical protein HHK36_007994 [Tetracentron sinense]|uniref:COP9 signalosome complex subunit 8 n=1 Tax=Tetracentron sinense TaxID=13715 RepID=A0A835DJL9_TETSI|nr:hypothetical protein HHK36_007994 [Tetracentron sinense]
MDFSLLKDAMASKSYAKIADICDELMLQAILLLSSSSFDWVVICISFLTSFCYLEEIEQVVSQGIAFQDDWPYTIHLLGHIYVDDVFLWKSIPSSIKESQPEVLAAWRIGQRLWMRDYAGVHEALRGFDWSLEVQELYTKRMFQLMLSAYSTISVEDTALFLGMNEEDATNYALQQGWIVDHASRMLTVKRQPIVMEQKLDHSHIISASATVSKPVHRACKEIGDSNVSVMRWSPPVDPLCKLNFDVAYDSEKRLMGIGIVVRHSKGEVEIVVAASRMHVGFVFSVECYALLRGIQLCQEMNLNQVDIEISTGQNNHPKDGDVTDYGVEDGKASDCKKVTKPKLLIKFPHCEDSKVAEEKANTAPVEGNFNTDDGKNVAKEGENAGTSSQIAREDFGNCADHKEVAKVNGLAYAISDEPIYLWSC